MSSVQGSAVRSCGCGQGIVVCSCMASPRLLRTAGELDHHPETLPWPAATTFDHHSPREGGGAMPAQRAYGMDQDVSPWSPMITRPVLRWPDNARVALAVIVNLEHWDWEVPPQPPLAVSPLGGPEGWSGPDFQETPRTPNLLAAEGIRYVCDWGNDEQPYKMTPQTGELYALGVHAYLDDNYIHLHGRRTINEVNRLWREWFDGLYADGATTGRLMVLHLHPWIMGQPWRIRHLEEVLGHICARQGVWKATGRAILEWL